MRCHKNQLKINLSISNKEKTACKDNTIERLAN